MKKDSYTILDNEIWEDENLSHAEFRVLTYLIRNYKVEYGYSFPLREQIIEKCHVNPKTLNKVLNTLEAKGYITRGKHKTKNGWNNIYYIHKYLVVTKNSQQESDTEVSEEKVSNSSDEAKEPLKTEDTEPIQELTTNELLVKEKVKLKSKMNDNERTAINEMDTELLIKAIEKANGYKSEGYHIGYLLKVYNSIKEEVSKIPTDSHAEEVKEVKTINNSSNDNKIDTKANTSQGEYYNNSYPVRTKYHGTFNEHFRKYSADELEAKLLRAQNNKRGIN